MDSGDVIACRRRRVARLDRCHGLAWALVIYSAPSSEMGELHHLQRAHVSRSCQIGADLWGNGERVQGRPRIILHDPARPRRHRHGVMLPWNVVESERAACWKWRLQSIVYD